MNALQEMWGSSQGGADIVPRVRGYRRPTQASGQEAVLQGLPEEGAGRAEHLSILRGKVETQLAAMDSIYRHIAGCSCCSVPGRELCAVGESAAEGASSSD